jgi:dTDP-4-dehydrorhamnose 3,5-epimerase
MNVIQTAIPDVLLLEPQVFGDARGFFFESFNQRRFEEAVGRSVSFVQDNHSMSTKGVLRGLHCQNPKAQGKLVRVIAGEVYDVAVDLRRSSTTFGRWVGVALSAENKRMIWMPPGFAHGFYVVSERAELAYKATEYWARECEHSLLWNDATLGIDWPLSAEPVLSAKDAAGLPLERIPTYP